MEEHHARDGRRNHGCRTMPFVSGKLMGSPGLIMVLDEPDAPLLEGEVCRQVVARGAGPLPKEPVIKHFVVGVVKPKLLQVPLSVPVGFCQEEKSR